VLEDYRSPLSVVEAGTDITAKAAKLSEDS
jgi:hypothetical protein